VWCDPLGDPGTVSPGCAWRAIAAASEVGRTFGVEQVLDRIVLRHPSQADLAHTDRVTTAPGLWHPKKYVGFYDLCT
jgi:hypothetical protein